MDSIVKKDMKIKHVLKLITAEVKNVSTDIQNSAETIQQKALVSLVKIVLTNTRLKVT